MKDRLDNIDSIKSLFALADKILIPPYQRAYSWESKQYEQFFEDLIEQKGKKYYLGQFLFEKKGSNLYIIDGQQRLTTAILLITALANLEDKKSLIRKHYLSNKFETIEDDQILFRRITQKQFVPNKNDAETTSQRRLIGALKYFTSQVKSLTPSEISIVKKTLEDAVISAFFISSKIEATQVFEYQNNRGKALSRFEVVKAYLMHQIYLHTEEEDDSNSIIYQIQTIVAKTYRYLESVEGFFSEPELLDVYCSLFFSIQGNIDEIKERLQIEKDKTSWILNFFENFAEIAASAKSIVSNQALQNISNLFFLGNRTKWKNVLLTIFYKGDTENEYYEKIIKLLEILCFKLRLGDYRSDYLPTFAKDYFDPKKEYDIRNLYTDIKHATDEGFQWYWNQDLKFKNIVADFFNSQNHHYSYRSTIKYVLWQYENKIRMDKKSGALVDKEYFDDYTIEHICPQNPKGKEHSKEFKENYLNIIGNLALLTRNQNSKFSNKSFLKKKELFQDTALSSYTEIREKEKWEENEIRERNDRIATFAINYFDSSDL